MAFDKTSGDPSYTRLVEDLMEQFTALMSTHTFSKLIRTNRLEESYISYLFNEKMFHSYIHIFNKV